MSVSIDGQSMLLISAGRMTSILDGLEKERDAARAENARLRTVLAALCDAAEVALRRIDGYDAILDPLAEAVDAARNEMATETP